MNSDRWLSNLMYTFLLPCRFHASWHCHEWRALKAQWMTSWSVARIFSFLFSVLFFFIKHQRRMRVWQLCTCKTPYALPFKKKNTLNHQRKWRNNAERNTKSKMTNYFLFSWRYCIFKICNFFCCCFYHPISASALVLPFVSFRPRHTLRPHSKPNINQTWKADHEAFLYSQ